MGNREAIIAVLDEMGEEELAEVREWIQARQRIDVRDTVSYLDDKPKKSILARAEMLGMVGCIDDGPGDLATNPKHMLGYGE